MRRIYFAAATVFAISLVTITETTHAAIVGGDVISIDFRGAGGTAPAVANWNDFVYDGVGGDTTLSNLVRLSDGANTGVSILVESIESEGTGFADGSAFGGSSDASIYQDGLRSLGDGNDLIDITISGLDDSLTYDIFGGAFGNTDFGVNWVFVEGSGPTTPGIGPGNTFTAAPITEVATNGSGVIKIRLNDKNNGGTGDETAAGIAELTITANTAPEPSTLGLLSLGVLGSLLVRCRRKR